MGIHTKNRLLIVLVAAIFTVGIIGGILFYMLGNTRPLTGEGTEQSPYLIATRADWEAFAYNVRHGYEENDYYADTFFLLTGDIDFKNRSIAAVDGFKGVFDGGGYRLKNIKKSRVVTGDVTESGLFGELYSDAIVKNLFVENFTHSTKADAFYQFGVVARTVHEGAQITNCHVSASFDTPASQYGGSLVRPEFGGIAAINQGTIAYSSVKMGETKKNTGGIVAQNNGSVVQCYADIKGVQGGGIVYANDEGGKVSRCVATGSGRSVGGIFMYTSSFASVDNSISTVLCDPTPFPLTGQEYSSFSSQFGRQENCHYLYFDRYTATSPDFYQSALSIYGAQRVSEQTAQLSFERLGKADFLESLGFSLDNWIVEEGKSPRLLGSYSDGNITNPS